ncbi:B-cell lymphoma 3 protein homolog isoform X1 [Ctenopharyngodon idella]|uniref:B-cell lymphoma 3 protein homolog isoform X1 n=1 Tax=Ctenopharyngodon idella TaxID=7959 RepID=UPI00222E5B56|nr:B-cell lymphoma 3 protein homolog isoform X1 [Ctenopharyngodon idella]
MTMSGSNHTMRSVPLDLTNKTRERGSSAQTGDQGRPRHTPERQVKPEHKCSNGHGILPSEPQDSCDGAESQTTQTDDVRGNRTREGPKQTRPVTPSVKCITQTDAAGKPADSSVSKLPLRKRPFPPDVDHDSSGPRNIPQSPSAKLQIQTQTGAARKSNPILEIQSFNDSQFVQHVPYLIQGYPYFPCPRQYTSPQKSSLSPPYTLESTDRILADIAAATHQDEDGDTPLHIAVVKGNIQLVSWLIEIFRRARKDLDIFNNLWQTPLHLAVITKQPILVKALLDAGSDPGALDRNGQTALHLCCEHEHVDCLSVILGHYPQNPSPHLEIRNYEGLTPLHLAVQNGNETLTRLLLESGAEINAGDNKSGRSALIHAVENNSNDMVILLIESGCDVNAQSYSGNTALHSACGRGQIEIVRVLLKNGADSSLKNNHNDTAIMVAKNKKVSDVLRGRGTRSCTGKTGNGSLSPGSSNHSPRMTPTFQRSTSHSPVTPNLPRSQSAESISERQSPMNSNEKTLLQMLPRTHHNIADNRAGYGMAFHPFHYLSPSGYDQMKPTVSHIQRSTLITNPLYYPPGIQRPPYYPDAHIIFLPSIHVPITHGSPSQGAINQSRPSSRSSDQSDMSTVSVNSEERGVS